MPRGLLRHPQVHQLAQILIGVHRPLSSVSWQKERAVLQRRSIHVDSDGNRKQAEIVVCSVTVQVVEVRESHKVARPEQRAPLKTSQWLLSAFGRSNPYGLSNRGRHTDCLPPCPDEIPCLKVAYSSTSTPMNPPPHHRLACALSPNSSLMKASEFGSRPRKFCDTTQSV